jgi:hypothetical protein
MINMRMLLVIGLRLRYMEKVLLDLLRNVHLFCTYLVILL